MARHALFDFFQKKGKGLREGGFPYFFDRHFRCESPPGVRGPEPLCPGSPSPIAASCQHAPISYIRPIVKPFRVSFASNWRFGIQSGANTDAVELQQEMQRSSSFHANACREGNISAQAIGGVTTQ